MKYICNKVKSGHCKGVKALSKCIHAEPHDKLQHYDYDITTNCTIPDECYRHGEIIKVKCVKIKK